MGFILKSMIAGVLLGIAWVVAYYLPRDHTKSGVTSDPLSPKKIVLWAIGIALFVGLLLYPTGRDTTIAYFANVCFGRGWQDSWIFLDIALKYLHDDPSRPIYTDLFFHSHAKFQYPVTSLLPWSLLQQIPGVGYDLLVKFANYFSLLFLGLTGMFSGIALRLAWIKSTGRLPNETRLGTFAYLSGSILCSLLFYPLTRSWQLGQVQTSLSCFAIASVVCWQLGRPRLAGLLLGICCLAKPQWAIALAWGFLHREFAFALTGTVVCAAAGLLAGWLYGFGQYLDYLPAMSFMSRTGEAYYPNQSMNGFLNRLLQNGDNLVFHSNSFAPYHPVVHAATLISGAVLIGIALFRHLRLPKTELDLALVLLALTIASPIAWEHHYGLTIGLLAVVTPFLLREVRWKRIAPWVLGITWIIIGQNVPVLLRLADTPFNFLQSHLFFGGILLFLLLLLARPTPPTSVQSS